MTPSMNAARQKLLTMQAAGYTQFRWIHRGGDGLCGAEDHAVLDGRIMVLGRFLKSGKTAPGELAGCDCLALAIPSGLFPHFNRRPSLVDEAQAVTDTTEPFPARPAP